jgi:nitrogen fixation protein FixH
MTRTFTGRHMALIMVAFFGVIIAVNLFMASNAVRTFGGVVVQNSYVASQRFNGWLDAARAQDKLGWVARATVQGDRLVVTLAGPDGAIDGALVAIDAEHPLGRMPGRAFALNPVGAGRYVAPHALPAGRWRLRIQAQRDGIDARFLQEIRL